jgi:tRNA(Arg) A34 adenosine deaminase TadA
LNSLEENPMDEKFMARAIAIAAESIEQPGTLPYGAVIVKDGEIIGEGLNRAGAECDPTSHGEVEAIRDACRKLSSITLDGADLYTSGEPCSMCVATMYQVGIARLFYAGAADDSAAFFDGMAEHDPKWTRRFSNQELRQQVGLPIGERDMPAEQMMLADMIAVFDAFAKRHA